MEFTPPFSHWLKKRRQQLDLTQADLARRAGYATVTLRKLESGELRPSRQLADRLADYLDVPTDQRKAFVDFATGAASHHPPHNLPAPPNPLIGRARELTELGKLLRRSDVRLVTLVGPPGVGKTRLALQLASDHLDAFPDGAWFVPLAPISDPESVAPAVAFTLDLKSPGSLPALELLKQQLRDKRLLLVLDNFEQLLPTAPLVADLLSAAPALVVLVTSRAALRLSGEHNFEVPPLSLPEPGPLLPAHDLRQFAAVELFAQRAQAAHSAFALTDANASAVATICRHLDGLPLAIELAAVRAGLFSPEALLAHLDHHVGAALRLLTGGPRDLPARQRTLRAAIDWSYSLLNEDEQRLFRCLGVFIGGFTLDAAQSLTPNPQSLISNLQSLLDHSLVERMSTLRVAQNEHGQEPEMPRYTLLEMIREYALDQLEACGEADLVRQRHAEWCAQLAEDTYPKDWGSDTPRRLHRLEEEEENLRAALAWCQATAADPLVILRLYSYLGWYLEKYGFKSSSHVKTSAFFDRLRYALDHCPDPPKFLRACALLCLTSDLSTEPARQIPICDQALELFRELGDTQLVSIAGSQAALVAYFCGDFDRAEILAEETLAAIRELGDRGDKAIALFSQGLLGRVAIERGNFERAASILEKTLAMARAAGYDWLPMFVGPVAQTLKDLGLTRLLQGDYEHGTALSEKSLALFDEAGDLADSGWVLLYLGYAARAQGRFDEARLRHTTALESLHVIEHPLGQAVGLAGLAETLRLQSHLQASARLFGAFAHHAAEVLDQQERYMNLRFDVECIFAASQAALAGAELASAWAEGQAMTLEQAIEYALEQPKDIQA